MAKAKTVTTAEFELLKPEHVPGCVVTKEDFFALTSLSEMEAQGAEDTYQRWLMTGRVKQTVETVEDPTGLTEDRALITIEARYVNSERRRVNVNKRETAKAIKASMNDLPPAFRNVAGAL